MANPAAVIDYKKCKPEACDKGICAAAEACPNKVLRQEEPFEYPMSRPSSFCKGCAKCNQACPLKAITIVT